MKLEQANHIAIVRLSALGDVCHAMLVVAAIQQRYPQVKITWLTSPLEAQLVRHLANVTVIEYDKKSGVKGMLALRRQCAAMKFDVLLHMQWSLRASLLSRMLRARVRVGFALSHSREKQHWFVNHLAAAPKGPHVLDSLLSLARAIDVEPEELSCELALAPLPASILSQLPESFVAINPSASKAERNWTLAGYQGLLDYFAAKGVVVVLTGGPSQEEVAFADQVIGKAKQVVNLVGKTSIPQMLAVIAAAKILISPDTGPVHMATLVATPVVGLYAHSNPQRTGPYKNLDQVVSAYPELALKEYGKSVEDLPWAARVHDPKAMTYIALDAVIQSIERLI